MRDTAALGLADAAGRRMARRWRALEAADFRQEAALSVLRAPDGAPRPLAYRRVWCDLVDYARANSNRSRSLELRYPERRAWSRPHFEATTEEDSDTDPLASARASDLSQHDQAEQGEAYRRLAVAMTILPARSQRILRMYYWHETSLRKIGIVLGISESRVHQLHWEAIRQLAAALFDRTKGGNGG